MITSKSKHEKDTCRFCGCHGEHCSVPEGQHGYRTCFWLDKGRTVCAAASCALKWEKEKNGVPVVEKAAQSIDPFTSFLLIQNYRGIQSRIAKRFGVSRTAVSQVVSGKKKSARISAALAEESALIDFKIQQTVLSLRADRAAKKQGAKPRIVLRCMDTPSFSSTFGVTLATVPGVGGAIEIGRPHAEAVS
jgi:hypothetical protein